MHADNFSLIIVLPICVMVFGLILWTGYSAGSGRNDNWSADGAV